MHSGACGRLNCCRQTSSAKVPVSVNMTLVTGGEKLSAYLDNIKGDRKTKLVELLKKFYPNLVDYKITSQKSGWKKLSVYEQFEGQKLETEALHLNDGLLRILAVLTQADADRSLLLLDELENGINQEIVETLVDTLLQSPQQLLVTTHSPLLLNYLPDDVAREAVQFLYKTPQGETKIRRFSPSPACPPSSTRWGRGMPLWTPICDCWLRNASIWTMRPKPPFALKNRPRPMQAGQVAHEAADPVVKAPETWVPATTRKANALVTISTVGPWPFGWRGCGKPC